MGQNATFAQILPTFRDRCGNVRLCTPMNVLFVQPALPQYRIPFFAELQRHAVDGVPIRVRVWCDHHHPLVPHSDPHGLFETAHRTETSLGPFLWQPALLEAVRDPWADVVVLSWNTRYVQLAMALVEARLRRRALVLWGHGYSKRFNYWRHQTRNWFGRAADACITYSEGIRVRLGEEGIDPNKIFCAPNALDGGPLQEHRHYWLGHTEELRALQDRLGLEPGRVLLFVSRLEPDKRVDLLLQAFSMLAPRVPRLQLVIVGGGTEREKLQQHAQALGVAGRSLFLGAVYDERVLAGIFASANVFVYPVAVGLSILHALNYGLPVITSDNPDCHNPEFDVLTPGENSVLYRHDDVGDLAAQIERVVRDRTLQTHLAEGALRSVTGPSGRTLSAMAQGMVSAIRHAHGSAHS